MPKKFTEKQVKSAIAELDKVRKQWLRRPGVTAVDVGYKISGEKITDELAIRVHVQRKLPVEALESYEVFSVSGSPNMLGGFPIDVIEAEYGSSRAAVEYVGAEDVSRTGRVDPLVGGISVGHFPPPVAAGTLGAIVYDKSDGKECILSNWHVLVESAAGAAGDAIYQPGPYDGGTAADTVATLKRWRIDADMDAALAELNGARGSSRDILGLHPIAGIDTPTLGMNVVKSGRTTVVTQGIIDGVSASVNVKYHDGVIRSFHNQIHIVPRPPWPAVDYEVSDNGDSGAIWINETNDKAVALNFAGETEPAPIEENAIASPMAKVATTLNFQFDPVYIICKSLICFTELTTCKKQNYICVAECVYKVFCVKLTQCKPLFAGTCFKELINWPPWMPVQPQNLAGDRYAVIDMASLSPDMRRAVERMLAEIAASEED